MKLASVTEMYPLGWIQDAIDLKIVLHNTEKKEGNIQANELGTGVKNKNQDADFAKATQVYSDSTSFSSSIFQPATIRYSLNEIIRGEVKIQPAALVKSRSNSTRAKVWHNGVFLYLQMFVTFFETMNAGEIRLYESLLLKPSYLSQRMTLPFEIDLKKFQNNFVESYNGKILQVDHSICVYVSRPWYTFGISAKAYLHLYKVEAAPLEERIFQDDDMILQRQNSSTKPQNTQPATPKKHRLRVFEVTDGLMFEYNRANINLGECLCGTIHLGYGNPASIKSQTDNSFSSKLISKLKLIIYEIESGDGQFQESFMLEKDFKVLDRSNASPCSFSVLIPIYGIKKKSGVIFGPTIYNSEYSVSYFIRLIAETENQKTAWSTHELKFYRHRPIA